MGGLNDNEETKMSHLDTKNGVKEENLSKKIEENSSEEEKTRTEICTLEEDNATDNLEILNEEIKDGPMATQSPFNVPDIQVIPDESSEAAHQEIPNSQIENLDVRTDNIEIESITLHQESTDVICEDTRVDEVVSGSSVETGTGIVTNIEAGEADGGDGIEAGDNPILEDDQRGPETSSSPVTMAEEATVASSDDIQPKEDTDNAAREAEEAQRREEEIQRKAEEEAIRKAAAEEEATRKQEAELRAKREEEKKAALEKFDSFDVIGDLVDKENQELARKRRETNAAYRPSSSMADPGLEPGKEKSELGRELWDAASQGKAGPVKMLLAAGADPNFMVRTGLMSTSSPLVTASCRGHTSVIDSLLEHPDILVNMSVSGGKTSRCIDWRCDMKCILN